MIELTDSYAAGGVSSRSPECLAPVWPSVSPQFRGKRAVVVDDDATARRILADLLKGLGCEVVAFERAADALRQVARRGADLVITDLFMPDCDGMELILALRQLRPRPRIIVVSGGSIYWHQALESAQTLGADATLGKPFGVAEFGATVGRALAATPSGVR